MMATVEIDYGALKPMDKGEIKLEHGDEDEGAAWGSGGREGLAAVATTVPSSRRDRLKLGSYVVDPEICG